MAGYLFLWSVYWLFKQLTGKEGMGARRLQAARRLGAWVGLKGILPTILLCPRWSGAIVGSIWLFAAGQATARRRFPSAPTWPSPAGSRSSGATARAGHALHLAGLRWPPSCVAVTGGIASGKSAVAARSPRAASWSPTPTRARAVVQPGEPALAEIAARSAPMCAGATGRLDRAALRAHGVRRRRGAPALEAITASAHPRRLRARPSRGRGLRDRRRSPARRRRRPRGVSLAAIASSWSTRRATCNARA
jgi:hypothetical protein